MAPRADSILDAITEQSKAPVIGSPAGATTAALSARSASATTRAAAAAQDTWPVGTPMPFSAGTASSPLGQQLTYRWDFGDGTILDADSQTTVVSHIYTAPFDGDVKLTVTDEDGRTAQSLTAVSIHGDPVAAPAGLAAPTVAAADHSITATWAPPAAGEAAYYELRRDGETVGAVGAGQPLSLELSDLDNGVAVSVSVVAYDAYGRSAESPAASAAPNAASAGSSGSSGTSSATAQASPAAAISRLRLTPNHLHRTGRHAVSRHPARISYRLTVRARVTFTVQKVSSGVRRGKAKTCRAASAKAKGARCTRLTAMTGHLSHASAAGANSVSWNGRLGRRVLPAGRYRMVASAPGAMPVSVAFVVS